jgi:hypothetical protein
MVEPLDGPARRCDGTMVVLFVRGEVVNEGEAGERNI